MKVYLLTEFGYEHCETCAVVLGDENADMEALKKEFEKYVNFTPIDTIDNYTVDPKKREIKINEALGKLVDDGYAELSEDRFDAEIFLTGFANWLVKNKDFTKVDFEECGYRYFG